MIYLTKPRLASHWLQKPAAAMYQRSERSFLQTRTPLQNHHRAQKFEDELHNLFNKKFKFRFSDDWTLPETGAWFVEPPWTAPTLEALKSKLNFHKSQLNDFDIEEWSAHTRRRNPAGEVCWRIRSHINPEFLTQAWTKFYECAYSYNIVPEQAVSDGRMVSLHLCEAPGAFITSLNHFLKSHHPDVEVSWSYAIYKVDYISTGELGLKIFFKCLLIQIAFHPLI